MSWYSGTHACGHKGEINIVGPGRQREWIAKRHFERLCEECWAKKLEEERQQANEESAKKAAEMELPDLEGTEKQVAWANTLRQKVIEQVESVEGKAKEEDWVLVAETLQYMLTSKTRASFWIENRDERLDRLFRVVRSEIEKKEEETVPEQVNIKAESTVYPEQCNFDLVATISIGLNGSVAVGFPDKNDAFREIVRKLGYSWHPRQSLWTRSFTDTAGDPKDRAAELGNKLLLAGFPISIVDEEIRQMSIDGRYEPECTRWIQARIGGEYAGWLVISWDKRKDDLYSVARRIPGSRWDSPHVVVPAESYQQVLDFADMYGCGISDGAKAVIERARQIREQSLVNPERPKAGQTRQPTDKPIVLDIPEVVEVDAELRDDD